MVTPHDSIAAAMVLSMMIIILASKSWQGFRDFIIDKTGGTQHAVSTATSTPPVVAIPSITTQLV